MTSSLITSTDDLPHEYGLVFQGTMFEPDIRDGDTVVLSKLGTPRKSDIVAVWLRPEKVRDGQPQVSLWRMAMNLAPGVTFPHVDHPASEARPLAMFESKDPQKMVAIPCSDILCIHRVQRVIAREIEPEEQAAVA